MATMAFNSAINSVINSATEARQPRQPRPGRAAARPTEPGPEPVSAFGSEPHSDDLDIRLNQNGPVPIVLLTGELHEGNAGTVQKLVDDFAAQGVFTLILDLRRLFAADLTGLVVLRDAAAFLQECGGVLALAAPRPRMRYLLKRTGAAEQFAVYKTTGEAVLALAADVPGPRREPAADLRRPLDRAARPLVPALMSALSKR